MRLKKLILTAVTGACLMGALTACGGSKDTTATTAATTQAAAETTEDAKATEAATNTSSDLAFISYNGVELRPGMTWADVKDSLGSESKPMEKIEPCGGGDYIQELYFYKGLQIFTLRSETIISIEVPMSEDGDAALAGGKIKKGDSIDSVKEVFGEPTGDEWQAVYEFGDSTLMFYLDNGTVTGIMLLTTPK